MNTPAPRVLVAAPVRNRAWILDRYLDALSGLDHPADRLGFHWIVNDSTDGTLERLRRFADRRADRFCRVVVEQVDFGVAEADTDGPRRLAGPRRRAYARLAELRNRLLVQGRAWDHLFMVDSDVLVRPGTLARLLAWAHLGDVVAGLISNSPTRLAWNYLHYDAAADRYWRDPARTPTAAELAARPPFRVDLTGAVALYSRRACTVLRFAPGRTGEDEGLARAARAHGLELWLDPGARCEHVIDSRPVERAAST